MTFANSTWGVEHQRNKGISNDDLFKLMDRLSINEASALIAGASPSDVRCNDYDGAYYINIQGFHPYNVSEVFDTLLKVLSRNIIAGELKAQIVVNTNNQTLYLDDLKKDWLVCGEIDTRETTIARNDLKQWLDDRGVYPPIFFPNGRKDDYMNPEHECYSPDLALCVRAWEVAQTAHYDNETIKQFMAKWIKENASNYGWINAQNPKEPIGENKAQELASVANWDIKGRVIKSNPNLKEPTPPLQKYKPLSDELKINLPPKPLIITPDDIGF